MVQEQTPLTENAARRIAWRINNDEVAIKGRATWGKLTAGGYKVTVCTGAGATYRIVGAYRTVEEYQAAINEAAYQAAKMGARRRRVVP